MSAVKNSLDSESFKSQKKLKIVDNIVSLTTSKKDLDKQSILGKSRNNFRIKDKSNQENVTNSINNIGDNLKFNVRHSQSTFDKNFEIDVKKESNQIRTFHVKNSNNFLPHPDNGVTVKLNPIADKKLKINNEECSQNLKEDYQMVLNDETYLNYEARRKSSHENRDLERENRDLDRN